MKPDVLLVEPLMPEIEDALDANYRLHRLYRASDAVEIEAALSRIKAVVTGGGSGLSNDWISKLPALGVIAINGVGTDKVDLKFARSRNIDVTTTPGVLTDDVADIGIALMLALLRRVPEGDQFVRLGRWPQSGFPLGRSLKGKRVGILGLGQIGKAFGRRAEAFGMTIGYWNRSPLTDCIWNSFPSPAALAANSDVLVVCIAATSSTQDIVDATVLRALGKDGVLINISRGNVVDETALLDALNDGVIGGAGLDVFVNEPNIRSGFSKAPNTVLTPHQGSATYETRLAMGKLVVANVDAYFAGATPPTTVN